MDVFSKSVIFHIANSEPLFAIFVGSFVTTIANVTQSVRLKDIANSGIWDNWHDLFPSMTAPSFTASITGAETLNPENWQISAGDAFLGFCARFSSTCDAAVGADNRLKALLRQGSGLRDRRKYNGLLTCFSCSETVSRFRLMSRLKLLKEPEYPSSSDESERPMSDGFKATFCRRTFAISGWFSFGDMSSTRSNNLGVLLHFSDDFGCPLFPGFETVLGWLFSASCFSNSAILLFKRCSLSAWLVLPEKYSFESSGTANKQATCSWNVTTQWIS